MGQVQRVELGGGRTATITVEISEPGPARMVLGTTVPVSRFTDLAAGGRDAGSRWCRTFSQPGEKILPWDHKRRTLPAGVAEWHSFKDWPDDTTVTRWLTALLNTMPRTLLDGPALLPELDVYDPDGYSRGQTPCDGLSVLLTYNHEGEPNFLTAGLTAAEWRRRHRLVYATIRQHPNGHRVCYVPIQTGTWTLGRSKNGTVKGDGDVLAWWAGVGDYAGYDAYVPSVTTGRADAGMYPDPRSFFAAPLQLAAGSGRRLLLAELGVIVQGAGGDTGALRAGWIRAAVRYLAEAGVAGAAWWDHTGANDRDFRLEDPTSAQAWADALAS